MFQVNPGASFGVMGQDQEGSDDDSISLTSTVPEHDSEYEYDVEGILAEHKFPDGKVYYLVEWSGFPLHESTWEPESNLSAELKAVWEEEKTKHATGELKPFDLQKFYNARAKAKKEKRDRRRRRNLQRQKLGLPLTEVSSEDEAVEETGAEVADSDGAAARPPTATQSKNLTTAPTSTWTLATTITDSPRTGIGNTTRPSAEVEKQRREAHTPARSKQMAPPETVGDQGTARNPSTAFTGRIANKSKAEPVSFTLSTGLSAVRSVPKSQKNLTAKKSTTQPTGNVFAAGKTRKQRPGLSEAMSDPTKAPKLLTKFRHRRMLEVQSQRKEDIAPDASKIELLDLRSGQIVGRRSSGGFVQSPTQTPPGQDLSPRVPWEASAPTNPLAPVEDASAAAPPKKKRKSVRFLGDEEDQISVTQEPDRMDVDSPPHEGHQALPSALRRPSLNLDSVVSPVQGTQSSDKHLMLGLSFVAATFNGLPRQHQEPQAWLDDFLSRKSLSFRRACFASTASGKLGRLIKQPLASGSILAKGDGPALERVSQYLTSGLLALFCGQTEFSVLIYPTKCEEWRWLPLVRAPTSPSEAELGYLIFSSLPECTSMLPPLSGISAPLPTSGDSMPNNHIPSPRAPLMKRLFSFDYHKLLPAASRTGMEHNFFLAVSNSRKEIAQALYHWLRANNPACGIFTSFHPGGWDAFRSRTEHVPGVVIIHETLIWSMRRFPHLSQKLVTKTDEYWCFSEPVHGLPLYPSISTPEYPTPPGCMQLTRLFPYRTAILLTPSFLVSEPRRSLEFLEWFMNWVGKFPYRLVTAHNIHDYMSELAEERYQARQELWNSPGDGQVDIVANLSGLSRDECRCRYQIAELVADLHIARMGKAGPFAHDEDSSSLVYADPSIDPSDEQSLVNWFGWWATLRADQFRKFHVVGSSHTIKMHGCRRGERRVRIPKYSQVTLSDSDAVLEVVREETEALGADAHGNGEHVQAPADEKKTTRFIQGPWTFRSNLVRMETPEAFADYLSDMMFQTDGFRQWLFYKFPVSWLDLQMATHFKDFQVRFSRISDWFNFTSPFGACYKSDEASGGHKPSYRYNTYIGFFYTIDKEWDGENPPAETSAERYPWIAIYRPVNPHIKPYKRCELIIWDPAASARYPGTKGLAETDLIFMQRQLIQYVRDHGEAKNHGTWLDQVWFGGWDWPPDCDSSSPIDVTLLFLQRLMGDIRNFAPAPERIMESKGYRRVALGSASPDARYDTRSHTSAATGDYWAAGESSNSSAAEGVRMDLDCSSSRGDESVGNGEEEEEEEEESGGEDRRIIFHPPRGRKATGYKPRSGCVNLLYEEARLARACRDAPTHMLYRYPPTMDWYDEQRAEGRGYEHVNVEPWEEVFKKLKIGEAFKVQGQNTDGRRTSTGSG